MNTEICLYVFDFTEDSGYHRGTRCRVSPINFFYSRETDAPKAETPGVDLHVQLVHAKKHWVAS